MNIPQNTYWLKVDGCQIQRHTNKQYAALICRLVLKKLILERGKEVVRAKLMLGEKSGPIIYHAVGIEQDGHALIKVRWVAQAKA